MDNLERRGWIRTHGVVHFFFIQHDLDQHLEGFNRVFARKLLELPQHLWAAILKWSANHADAALFSATGIG